VICRSNEINRERFNSIRNPLVSLAKLTSLLLIAHQEKI